MTEKKRIAIVHDKMNVGGTERVLVNLLKDFDYDHYEVTLWLTDDTGPLQEQINSHVIIRKYSTETVRIRELLVSYLKRFDLRKIFLSIKNKILSKKNIDDFYKNLMYDISTLPYADNTVYDAVIVYQGLYVKLLTAALFMFKARKKIAWIHMYFKHDDNDSEVFRYLYSGFDSIVCVSKDIKRHFDEVYGYACSDSRVIHNILDRKSIIENAEKEPEVTVEPPYILTVGRISEEKGQMMIPEIARSLIDYGYDIRWLIAGDGGLMETLKQKIRSYGLEDRLITPGTIMNPYPFYKNCLIYVQPSYSEGYCTSTCEAKVFSKPIVATDVSGMDEQFIHMKTGIICEPDVRSIYASIKLLLDDSDFRESLSEALRNENKDSDHANYLEVYRVINS